MAALFAAAGCGGDEEETPEPPAAPTEPTMAAPQTPTGPGETEPPDDEEEPTEVTVALVDFELEFDRADFSPGTYTFVAEQEGQNPHALSIEGPGVSESTPQLPPGDGSEELTVTLEAGTYEFWCPVPGHRGMGMEATIEVS